MLIIIKLTLCECDPYVLVNQPEAPAVDGALCSGALHCNLVPYAKERWLTILQLIAVLKYAVSELQLRFKP